MPAGEPGLQQSSLESRLLRALVSSGASSDFSSPARQHREPISRFTSADRANVPRSSPSAIAVQDKTFLRPAFQCDRVSIFDSASQAIIAASRWLTTAGSPA
jgi:hypothetical protein